MIETRLGWSDAFDVESLKARKSFKNARKENFLVKCQKVFEKFEVLGFSFQFSLTQFHEQSLKNFRFRFD